MTDRNDAVLQIERMLGSEGSETLASKVFDLLVDLGSIEFNPQTGYTGFAELSELPDYKWNEILAEAEDWITLGICMEDTL